MKFIANRKIMLEHLKSMIKTVPKASIVKEQNGFLIEANEDDGYLYLTANNHESAIQRKLKVAVEAGGAFVIDARFFIDMLTLLSGNDVVVEMEKPGVADIKSGSCTYTVKVTDSRIYQRPDIPFPGETVKINGLKQLYSKTNAAAATGDASKVLAGIHVDINNKGICAVGCDTHGLAVAVKENNCGGNMAFTLHKSIFSNIAGVCGNDEIEVGKSGPFIVFMKEGMLFSAKAVANEYVNIDMILNSMQLQYLAKADIAELKNAVEYVYEISAMGNERSYICIDFGDGTLDISTANDIGKGSTSVNTTVVEGGACGRYYYPAGMLKDIFKTVEGTILIQLDKRGYLMVMDRFDKFMLTPIMKFAVERQNEKFFAKKNPKKSKSKAA